MESMTLEEFKTILIHLLTVALSETVATHRFKWIDANDVNKNHSEKGREFLIHLMKDSRNEEFIWKKGNRRRQ